MEFSFAVHVYSVYKYLYSPTNCGNVKCELYLIVVIRMVVTGVQQLNRCIRRVKGTIWWPLINQQVEDIVTSCEICLKNKPQQVEPMISTEVQTRPWFVIGADLAEYKGNMYLVVQDYYSKYPEVRKLSKITSASIIKSCKHHHGILNIVRSDNGKQFACYEFKEFAIEYGFKWISSSPEYQQSNGQAESAVKLIKSIFKKNSADMDLALLSYRNTPLSCGASPAQLLYGRSLRDRIPTLEKKLIPKLPDHDKIEKKMLKKKEKQNTHYDSRHRVEEKKQSSTGDKVWIINMQREGVIEQKLDEPRSFRVRSDRDSTVRRNSRHLQVLPKQSTSKSDDKNDETCQLRDTRGYLVSERERPKRERKAPKYLDDYV